MDLGEKQPTEPTTAVAMLANSQGEGKEPKIRYPSFCIRDELAEEFAKQFEVKKDEEFTAVVKLKVCGWSDEEYGKRVELSVMEISPKGEKSGKSESADEDEETESGEKPAISALLKG